MSRATTPVGFETVHAILGAAARAAGVTLVRPHCGGPLPILSALSQLRVGLKVMPVPLVQRVADGEQLVRETFAGEHIDVATRWMMKAAKNYLFSLPSARNAIGDAVAHAIAAAEPDLVWLDQLIVIEELDALIGARPHDEIVRVISRPAAANGKLGAVVAEMKHGYGVYTKVGARWMWSEGTLGDVTALVPDALLPAVGDDLAG